MQDRRWQLNALVAGWLGSDAVQEGPIAELPAWDTWLWKRMLNDEIVVVGKVLVDRRVLTQRFACVSSRCAPGRPRGAWRSCCADIDLNLSPAEATRLHRAQPRLLAFLRRRGIELDGNDPWLGVDSSTICRPAGRCVFSCRDRLGRLRCSLHSFARQAGLDRGRVQPINCRLFPLIVVDVGDGRVVLTVVSPTTHALTGSYPASRYPCLSDPALPPLWHSMRADLDWIFGPGFARVLAKTARASSAGRLAQIPGFRRVGGAHRGPKLRAAVGGVGDLQTPVLAVPETGRIQNTPQLDPHGFDRPFRQEGIVHKPAGT